MVQLGWWLGINHFSLGKVSKVNGKFNLWPFLLSFSLILFLSHTGHTVPTTFHGAAGGDSGTSWECPVPAVPSLSCPLGAPTAWGEPCAPLPAQARGCGTREHPEPTLNDKPSEGAHTVQPQIHCVLSLA